MKIFLDTADPETIRAACATGNLDGVTTNNTSSAAYAKDRGLEMSPANVRRMAEEIAGIFSGAPASISIETVGTPDYDPCRISAAQLVDEALEIDSWNPPGSKIFYVKIPSTIEGCRAIRKLKESYDVRVNATLGFSVEQARNVAIAGADYYSPFVGRMEAQGADGIGVAKRTLETYREESLHTRVLFASVRSAGHVLAAYGLGCHIVTMPYSVFRELPQDSLAEWRGREEPVGKKNPLSFPADYDDNLDSRAQRLRSEGLARFLADSQAVKYSILQRGA